MAATASPRPGLEFDSEFLRRLELLNVVAKKVFAGTLRADRRSAQKGVSAEFADHRSYVAGDDFRHIDWHLFGRLEDLFLKLYEEEENLHLSILLDRSPSMTYGDPDKLGYAMQVAAALAYIGMANMDSVNLVPVDRSMGDGLWGLSRRSSIFRVFDFLRGLPLGESTDLKRSCREFVSRRLRRGVVVVLSDFYDIDGFQAGLKFLKHPRHSIYALQVVDRLEEDPAVRGDLRLVDSEDGGRREINVTDGMLSRYRQAFAALQESVESFCIRNEMGYALARTEVPFDELVLAILRRGGLVR